MNKKHYILLVILGSFLLFSCSNKYYIKKGNKEYKKSNYYNASLNYKIALDKNPKVDTSNLSNLANSFFEIKDYDNAMKFYGKIDLGKRTYEEQLNYARILQFNNKVEAAKQAFIDLKEKNNKTYNDTTIDKFIESCDLFLNKKAPDYKQFVLNKSFVDIEGESFGATFYDDGIIYSKPNLVVDNFIVDAPYKTDKYGNRFKNLYYSKVDENGKLTNSRKLELEFNKDHHIGSVCVLPDSNLFFFSETVKVKDKSIIKIYSIERISEGEFKNKKELEFNSNSYSCAHPSITADGKQLFFTSDKKGGFGETDIYMSEFKDGKWGDAINLGNEINTEASETFPFIKQNGVLYFSSNGKVGFGGLDIYSALFIDGKWTHLVHKDLPLNSSADDFAYTENYNDNSQIAISSNRDSKPKNDNIFFVKKMALPPDTIRGRIYDYLTDKAIGNAAICLVIDSVSGDTIAKAYTDEDGNYTLIIPKKLEEDEEERLFTVIKKEGYEDNVIDFEGRYNDTDRPPFNNKNVAMKVKIEEEQVIEFHNIYFDFSKSDLKPGSIDVLDKLIGVMNDNPNMKIELSAHTDSKSSKKYNQKLSDKRANSAKTYMVSKGIDSKRIVAKGYGETRLLNNCGDKVECSDEEHAINRRIEVKVLSN